MPPQLPEGTASTSWMCPGVRHLDRNHFTDRYNLIDRQSDLAGGSVRNVPLAVSVAPLLLHSSRPLVTCSKPMIPRCRFRPRTVFPRKQSHKLSAPTVGMARVCSPDDGGTIFADSSRWRVFSSLPFELSGDSLPHLQLSSVCHHCCMMM